jgi:hypothetical protein
MYVLVIFAFEDLLTCMPGQNQARRCGGVSLRTRHNFPVMKVTVVELRTRLRSDLVRSPECPISCTSTCALLFLLLTIYSVRFLLLYTIYSPDFASVSYAAAPLVHRRHYAYFLGLVPRSFRVPRRPHRLTHKHFDPPFPHNSSAAEYLAGAGPLALLYSFDPPCLRAWTVHWFVTVHFSRPLRLVRLGTLAIRRKATGFQGQFRTKLTASSLIAITVRLLGDRLITQYGGCASRRPVRLY